MNATRLKMIRRQNPRCEAGMLLTECLVYMALLVVVLGLAYEARTIGARRTPNG